jgi:hypothetical protein
MTFSTRPFDLFPDLSAGAERGQTTAEYALVLLAAATIAMLVVAWAGTGAIGAFFDDVLAKITSMIA